jgi:hypothetical protein
MGLLRGLARHRHHVFVEHVAASDTNDDPKNWGTLHDGSAFLPYAGKL